MVSIAYVQLVLESQFLPFRFVFVSVLFLLFRCVFLFFCFFVWQLVEGDVLTHLNGKNARLLDFSDILKACRGPERGGLPRPLVMRFSR